VTRGNSQIVIGPDGIVLAVAGDLPPGLGTSVSKNAQTCRARFVTPGRLSWTTAPFANVFGPRRSRSTAAPERFS